MLTSLLRPVPHGDATGDRAGQLRRMLAVAGVLTAAVVAMSTVATGLPVPGRRRDVVVLLTVLALGGWLLVLVRRLDDPRLVVGCLLVTGLAGAWLDLLRPSGPGFVLAYMAVAGMGLRLPMRVAAAGGAVVLAAVGLAEARTSAHPWSAALTIAMGAGFLFLVGAFAGVSRDAHLRARALLEQQEATRLAQQEAAVLAERGRLARELHDVLAHTLSGLAVQLEATRLLAERTGADPRVTDQVRGAQRLAADGMAGARRAVSTLRGEILPGPADIGTLVDHARLTGLPTGYREVGAPREVSPEHGLALYRTVQEALTNSTKYAGEGAHAEVTVTWGKDDVCVEVRDCGGDRTPSELPSGGHGLTGLAERAALAGGSLDRGPTAEGWRVALSLPLRDAAEAGR